MFFHNLKYSLKTLFRNRMLIFWTFAFPIILGILFHLAFSDIEKNESLDIIDIAIVDTQEFRENEIMKEAFKVLSKSGSEEQLFQVQYVSKEKASELLDGGDITGYLLMEDEKTQIVIKSNGINETILKTVVEEIQENSIMINKIIEHEVQKNTILQDVIDYSAIYEKAIRELHGNDANVKNITSGNMSYTMIEFYTLIAMACLYGGILGSVAINQNLANMSNQGKRVAIAPISKLKVVLSSVLAGYVTQFIGIVLLMLFTVFVLRVDYGNQIGLIMLLALVGSFAGLSIGIAVSTLIKAGENIKTGIIIAVTMAGCFLSGMMGITMKYIIDTHVPIINKINPASMITDGFYALYYYKTLDRYWFDIMSLFIFSCILIFVSFRSLRRQKYDSI